MTHPDCVNCGVCRRVRDEKKIAEVREDDRVKIKPSKKPWDRLTYDEKNAYIAEYLGRGYYFD